MIEIEKGVPVPPPRKRTGHTALLRQLQPGDSVVLPIAHWKANALAYRVFGKGGFRSRKEAGGTRIWNQPTSIQGQ